jgi:hypothetical protein
LSPDNGTTPSYRHIAFVAFNLTSNYSATCFLWRFLPWSFPEVAQVHEETNQVNQELGVIEGIVPDDKIIAHLWKWNGVDPVTVRHPLLDGGWEEVGGHILR